MSGQMEAQVIEFTPKEGSMRAGSLASIQYWWEQHLQVVAFDLKMAGIEHPPLTSLRSERAWKKFLATIKGKVFSYAIVEVESQLRKHETPFQVERKLKKALAEGRLPSNVIRFPRNWR